MAAPLLAARTLKALKSNTTALLGLKSSMFSLRGVIGNLQKSNNTLAEIQGQTARVFESNTAMLKNFDQTMLGLEGRVEVLSNAMTLGITGFTKESFNLAANLKQLGVDFKKAQRLQRFNVQVLGQSEVATNSLIDTLVSTAAVNGDSIDGLISALQKVEAKFVDISAQIGPQFAAKIQQAVGALAPGQTALQDSLAQFATSLFANEEGFMKLLKLTGETVTGQESAAEIQSIIVRALERVAEFGQRGAIETSKLSEAFGTSPADIVLAQQLPTMRDAITQSAQLNTEQLANETTRLSLDKAFQALTVGLQEKMLYFLQKIAEFTAKLAKVEFSVLGGAAGGAAGKAAQMAMTKKAAENAAAAEAAKAAEKQAAKAAAARVTVTPVAGQVAKAGAARVALGVGGRLAALAGGPIGIGIAVGSILLPMLLKGNKKTEEVADTVDEGLKLDEKTGKAQADFWSQIEGDNSDAAKQRNEQIRQSSKLVELTRNAQEQERNIVNSRLLAELGRQALALNALVENSERQLRVSEEQRDAFERPPLRPQLVDPSLTQGTIRNG